MGGAGAHLARWRRPRRQPWRRWRPQKLSLRRQARRKSAAVRRGRASTWQAREVRHRAGKRARARIHLAAAATRISVALVMLVAGRGRCQRARSARHRHACGRGLEGDAGGGQSRAVLGEVVRRSRAQQAARVRGGRRAEGRARRTSGLRRFEALTRDRLRSGSAAAEMGV